MHNKICISISLRGSTIILFTTILITGGEKDTENFCG